MRELLSYNPDTGEFTWRVVRHRRPAGIKAGCLDKAANRNVIMVDYRSHQASHLAWLWMTGKWPNKAYFIDHADNNPSNDRWSNLRLATPSQNQHNSRKSKRNTTGFKGVHFDKKTGRFKSMIMVRWKHHYLGSFASALEAHKAYVSAAEVLHGEFARAA